MGDYFDVEFIAYGNADTVGEPGDEGFSITCQHGPKECVGNIVQACTVSYEPNMFLQAALLSCMSEASAPEEAGETCFNLYGLPYSQIKACAEGPEGEELHFLNGEITNNLSPSAYGVPWP